MIIKEKDVKISVTSAKPIVNIIGSILKSYDEVELNQEHLYTIGLDGRNHILFVDLTNIGSQNQSIVDVKTIFRLLLIKGAENLILVHNHPSNYAVPEPSKDDDKTTYNLIDACKLLDIAFLDHIVVSRTGKFYFSYREKGYID